MKGNHTMTSSIHHALLSTLLTLLWIGVSPVQAEWTGWGGPNGEFTLEHTQLGAWGENGPNKIWEQPLGGGYAAIVADGERIYTAYRIPSSEIEGRSEGQGREAVVALSATTGERLWQHVYEAPLNLKDPRHDLRYGHGPNATPLLAEGKLYVLGFTGQLHCLDAASGEIIWSHDLTKDFRAKMPYFGHAASPIRHGDALIVLAGSVMSFDLTTGELRWNNREIKTSYASPRPLQVGEGDQLVVPLAGEIAGLDPASGKVLWRHEHANQYNTILSSPLVQEGDPANDSPPVVFISAAWTGSRALAVRGDGVTELWHNPKMQIAHSNAVRVGDWIYASSGVEVDFLTAINLRTGEIAWKKRGLSHINLLRAGDHFILLDEDGTLYLADLKPEGVTVHHKVELFDSLSWTAPTLVGHRLYVRNEKKIVALDLAPPSPAAASAAP